MCPSFQLILCLPLTSHSPQQPPPPFFYFKSQFVLWVWTWIESQNRLFDQLTYTFASYLRIWQITLPSLTHHYIFTCNLLVLTTLFCKGRIHHFPLNQPLTSMATLSFTNTPKKKNTFPKFLDKNLMHINVRRKGVRSSIFPSHLSAVWEVSCCLWAHWTG